MTIASPLSDLAIGYRLLMPSVAQEVLPDIPLEEPWGFKARWVHVKAHERRHEYKDRDVQVAAHRRLIIEISYPPQFYRRHPC